MSVFGEASRAEEDGRRRREVVVLLRVVLDSMMICLYFNKIL